MRKLWILCLALWFLAYGLFAVTNLTIVWGAPLMGFLALAVAVLIFFDR